MTTRPLTMRVLFYRDPADHATWIAQALEYDIAAFGRDEQQARMAFDRTVSGYITMSEQRREEPFATLNAAPEPFWAAWQRVAGQQTIAAEPMPLIPGHIMRAVTNESVSAQH